MAWASFKAASAFCCSAVSISFTSAALYVLRTRGAPAARTQCACSCCRFLRVLTRHALPYFVFATPSLVGRRAHFLQVIGVDATPAYALVTFGEPVPAQMVYVVTFAYLAAFLELAERESMAGFWRSLAFAWGQYAAVTIFAVVGALVQPATRFRANDAAGAYGCQGAARLELARVEARAPRVVNQVQKPDNHSVLFCVCHSSSASKSSNPAITARTAGSAHLSRRLRSRSILASIERGSCPGCGPLMVLPAEL